MKGELVWVQDILRKELHSRCKLCSTPREVGAGYFDRNNVHAVVRLALLVNYQAYHSDSSCTMDRLSFL
jgi:hypothetical protein